MRPRWSPWLALVPALVMAFALAGCAGPSKLAKQSQQALMQGDLRKAYEKARRALEKDPANADARAAYGAAATQIAADYRVRIQRLAISDTLTAAREALEFRGFRAEVARHPVAIAEDPDDLAIESDLCTAAARIRYRQAEESLAARRPKEAYRRFVEAEQFQPDYRDVGRRVTATLERALTRVAILPFEDQVDVPDLAQDLAQKMGDEALRRSGSPALFFTRVVAPDEVMDKVTLGELRHMSRDRAVRIGRRLGADRVVYGRYTGLKVDNATYDFDVPVYRKVVERVPDGPNRERWLESRMNVRVRGRRIDVSMAFEVIDVDGGETRAERTVTRNVGARVAWTDYRAEGDCDAYALRPADAATASAERFKQSEERWKRTMGSWTLPKFLSRARSQPERKSWSREYRPEFYGDTHAHPVFLRELPDVGDLVYVALRDADEPVIAALREIDSED